MSGRASSSRRPDSCSCTGKATSDRVMACCTTSRVIAQMAATCCCPGVRIGIQNPSAGRCVAPEHLPVDVEKPCGVRNFLSAISRASRRRKRSSATQTPTQAHSLYGPGTSRRRRTGPAQAHAHADRLRRLPGRQVPAERGPGLLRIHEQLGSLTNGHRRERNPRDREARPRSGRAPRSGGRPL